MTFKQDDNETPVLFRAARDAGQTYITAVFPCEPADYRSTNMGAYAHVGQHCSCSRQWYNTTRAAKPEEYESLVRELEGAPYGYRLKVYKRMQPWMREVLRAEQNRLNAREIAS